MNLDLLKPEVQNFINSKIGFSTTNLAFEKNPFQNLQWNEVLNQIFCKTKAKSKLPSFFDCLNIIYPTKISLEQTSSEKTAAYKANLVSGRSLIDLTGGFGVDDYYFSKKIEKVIHCERNLELHNIVKHNFDELRAQYIECVFADSLDFLNQIQQKFDWIYIDPSRRNDTKGKVFLLQDCDPNVPNNLKFYFEKSDNILIKTAPWLDISAGISELSNVKAVHIVAVDNEVKELLWILEKNYQGNILINSVNLIENEVQLFKFDFQEKRQLSNYGLPQKYLFEPNAAIMKSGGFDEVAIQFKLKKLHQNSQLYTADTRKIFPGRSFEIINNFEYNKSNVTLFLKNKQANLTVRNFSETVAEIRKKWKIQDGGVDYVFFTTNSENKKIVLVCKKIN